MFAQSRTDGRGADQVPEGRVRPRPAQAAAHPRLPRRLPADRTPRGREAPCATAASTASSAPRRWSWASTSAASTSSCSTAIPGTVAATWQRFGRAGRRQQPSLGVLVASSQPLDQYVVRHPDFFADAPPEHARIAPDQPLILLDHIRCAAFELPFLRGRAVRPDRCRRCTWKCWPKPTCVHREGERWEWIADSYPAQRGVACARSPTATSWWSTAPTAGRRSSPRSTTRPRR